MKSLNGRVFARAAAMVVVCGTVGLGSAGVATAQHVAQVGNSSVIAAEGPGDSVYFYWQTIGTAPWHPEEVAAGETTYGEPSVAQVGNSSVIAAEGPGDSLYFYWQTIGTAPWHPEEVAGPGSIFTEFVGGPSVAQVGNSSVIAAEGPNQTLDFYWQTIGTGPWHPEEVAGPGSTYSQFAGGPSVAQVGNSSVIAADGPNGTLDFYWQTIGTGPWHSELVPGQVPRF